MIDYKKYKNVLVIGAGSGRDISSAVFVTEYLKQMGVRRISLAGFLTPWAVHYFDGKIEQPINLKIENSYKTLANDRSKKIKSYFEYLLPELNVKYDLGLEKIALFSLHWGYEKLEETIKTFVKKNKFDLVLLVDVGGDALVDKKSAKDVFTPFVDMTCIKICQNIKRIDRFVFIMSPGVDGEIGIREQKRILRSKKFSSLYLRDFEKPLEKYLLINRKINELTSSQSGTEKTIREILVGQRKLFNYVKTYKLLKKKYKASFAVRLEKEISSKMYIVNIENFPERNLIKKFSSIYDMQTSLRDKFCGSEVDMSFIPMSFSINGYDSCVFSLTPMNKMSVKKRREIINEGVALLKTDNFKSIIILKKDKKLIENKKNDLNFFKIGNLLLVKKHSDILQNSRMSV